MNKDKNQKLQEKDIKKEFYQISSLSIKIILLASIILFVLGFTINFPLQKIIHDKVSTLISKNPACPMNANELQINWFLPKIAMKSLQIPGRCINLRTGIISIEDISIKPGFPSISPLGAKFNISAKTMGTNIKGSIIVGITQVIKINKIQISGQTINDLLGNNIFSGNINLSASALMKQNNLQSANFSLSSNNFKILGGKIPLGALPMNIPELDLKFLQLKANLKNNRIAIKNFTIGDEIKSPVYTELKGTLDLHRHSKMLNNVNLKGELKIDEKLLKGDGPLAILNLLWQIEKKPHKQGRYQIRFKGPPQTAFLKPIFVH